ncbi:MAG: Alpha,alpha-trehalose-phosphate synthase (UDP-forming) [Dehalococcoidia bacterium]|nr:Alpha,alpha-trehalose-phosphate synthase (UDP-forming) [Dehalococcoidia bacterium]
MRAAFSGERKSARLLEQCSEMLRDRRLILASNRGPVEYHISPDGQLQAGRGSGGVVTALSTLTSSVDFAWVASAMGEGDRRAAQQAEGGRIRSPLPGQHLSLRYVVTPRRMYHKFYNVFCNPLLWFLQHYMWSSAYTPNVDDTVYDAWNTGYVPVNQAFADAIVEEAKHSVRPPYVMLHDYHLYLTPGMIRSALPEALIQHFIHIPWPDAGYWQIIPSFMRRAICEGLCACDIVGFQTSRDVRSFLQSCEMFLEGAQVDHTNCTVRLNGRETAVRCYPLSIDVEEMRRIADSPRALEHEKKLRPLLGEKTIVRVDRLEPNKNIVRGFHAYQLLLSRCPELHGKVKFLAFLVPSRTHIRQYQRYLEEVDALVGEINQTFGREGWQPVTVFYENNYTQAMAAMKLYDVLLVNSVIDGMNLVAKEGPVVNTRGGILILSETAGAYAQLQEGAIGVAPADVEGTAQAMYQAITASVEERERRASILAQEVEREDVIHWMARQMEDLKALA